MRTAVVFAVVRDHEHDLPFHDIIIDKTAAYPRDVLVGLHLFELPAQEGGCGCGGHLARWFSGGRDGGKKGEGFLEFLVQGRGWRVGRY